MGMKTTATVAKRIAKMNKADKVAHSKVRSYCVDYMQNRGLVATFPRICVAMMADLNGWPIRNADGGGNIAYFSTEDAAKSSVVACEQEFRHDMTNWVIAGRPQ